MNEIWNYYCALAEKIGRDENGKALSYSLEDYFPFNKAAEQNELVRTFLGDALIHLSENAPVPEDVIKRHISEVTPPYKEQLKAISNALSYPVSLVQGPPGTGKTEMILNLISVIHGIYPEKTIAVVSSNNEALDNIYSKISEECGNDPMLERLYDCFSVLGSKSRICDWRTELDNRNDTTAVRYIDYKDKIIDPDFLRQRPIFSSTIHSLRKIFKITEDFDGQFDYVIVDECSQVSVMLGLAAMSRAKNIVLIGDNNQLAPVINKRMAEVPEGYEDTPEIYREFDGKSFLSVCEEIFPNAKQAFLNEHYRCHPSIIDFCNEYVYNGGLDVKTLSNGDFRMRAVWYEGDYCEELYDDNNENENNNSSENSEKKYKCNQKQIEIFINEEFPRVLRLITEQGLSAAVLCPFKKELQILKKRLAAIGQETEENDESKDSPTAENIPQLTIHKAQGKGYDIVYFLTVEDYNHYAPWCQKMRMINVAVSRAKKEFCVITSSRWLPDSVQKRLTGYSLCCGSSAVQSPEDMFYCKLMNYISEKCPEPQGIYGLHKSGIVSVFDKVPLYRRYTSDRSVPEHRLRTSDNSAPALCVHKVLSEILPDNHTVLREVPLKALQGGNAAECRDEELLEYAKNSRLDFVVCQGNTVRLIIEVDGAYHRSGGEDRSKWDKIRKCDELKNRWMSEILGAEDIFLRIPTDGTTSKEEELIQNKLEESGNTSITISNDELIKCTITKKLIEVTNNCLSELRVFVDGHMDGNRRLTDEIAKRIQHDYVNSENAGYLCDNDISIAKNNMYICRYSAAYAFEYALMYDIVLRSMLASGKTDLRVTSFGCGSFLDALSLAYAKSSLASCDKRYSDIKMTYVGVDISDWNKFFIPPNTAEHPAISAADETIQKCFNEIQFCHESAEEYCKERNGQNFTQNVIFFPKILNELDDDYFEGFIGAFGSMIFTEKEYYICVSHSRTKIIDGVKRINSILSRINQSDEFDICCDIYEMIGNDNADDFNSKWLHGDEADELVKIQKGQLSFTKYAPSRDCYAFNSSLREESDGTNNNNYSSCHISGLNSDFKCSEAENYVKHLFDNVNKKIYKSITTVSQIAFQVIKLTRR
ncbi:MAG: AAA domain-containing protein [Firmicutes bacterium]|nr:AAA domain-containing protein [Bacillota bacterium]